MGSLSADSLSEIDDSFSLTNIQILTSLNFPALTSVNTVDWSGLANLAGLSFTAGLQKASTLSIQNTVLSTLSGISLETVDNFIVANNGYLNQVSMPLGKVTNSLSLEANGRSVHASFPNMIWANNMTFRNCSTVDVPSLASLNGSLGFYSNYFPSFSAPNLTTVQGSLAFVSNGDLTNVSMPELKQVGGAFQIANNTQYSEITGFPRVTDVGGAVDCNGEFTK